MISSVKEIRAWVDVDSSDEFVEGHYYAPSAEMIRLAPSDAICPFCFAPLETISAPIFGRIVKDEEKHQDGKTSAIVQLLPSTHTAMKCSNCDSVFTRTKDRQE